MSTQPETRPPGVVVLRDHPSDPDLVGIDTQQDMAREMGGFRPARFVGERGMPYVIRFDAVPKFLTYAKTRGWRVADSRVMVTPATVTYTASPLPECASCTMPASRAASRSLRYCPHCGARWHPVQVGVSAVTDTEARVCESCAHVNRGRLGYCARCGDRLGEVFMPAKRVHRDDPEPMTTTVQGVLAGMDRPALPSEPAHAGRT